MRNTLRCLLTTYVSDNFNDTSLDSKWVTAGDTGSDTIGIVNNYLKIYGNGNGNTITATQTITESNSDLEDRTIETRMKVKDQANSSDARTSFKVTWDSGSGGTNDLYTFAQVKGHSSGISIIVYGIQSDATTSNLSYRTLYTSSSVNIIYFRSKMYQSSLYLYYRLEDSGDWILLESKRIYNGFDYLKEVKFSKSVPTGTDSTVYIDYITNDVPITISSVVNTYDLSNVGHVTRYIKNQQPVNSYSINNVRGETAIKNKYRNVFTYEYNFITDTSLIEGIFDKQEAGYELYLSMNGTYSDAVYLARLPYEYNNDKLAYPKMELEFVSTDLVSNFGYDSYKPYDTMLQDDWYELQKNDVLTYKINFGIQVSDLYIYSYYTEEGSLSFRTSSGSGIYEMLPSGIPKKLNIKDGDYLYVKCTGIIPTRATALGDVLLNYLLVWGV